MTSNEILDYTMMVIAIGGALGLWPKLRKWIDAKADELAAQTGYEFIASIDDFMIALFVDSFHRVVKVAKKNGTWNEKTQAEAFATVIDATKEHFGMKKLLSLTASGSAVAVDKMLAGQGEAAILQAKMMGRAAKNS